MDLTGVVLLVASAGAVAWLWMARSEPVPALAQREDVVTLTATWTDTNGVTHTVQTTQQDGESQSAFEARHNACVANQLAKFPPAVGD